jgi:flagellar basal-body rod protein FlgB
MNPIGDRGLSTVTGWLDGLSRRSQATSNNIANIDTPGYVRQEVSFETELQRQFGQGATQMSATDPRHYTAGGTRSGLTRSNCSPPAAWTGTPWTLTRRW